MKENEIRNKLIKLIKHYKNNDQTGGNINYYNIIYYLIHLINIKTNQKIKLIISLKELYNNCLNPDVIESTIGHDNFQFLEKTLHINDILSGGKMDSDKYEYNMNMNVIIQYYNNHLLLINNEIKKLEHINTEIKKINNNFLTSIKDEFLTKLQDYKRLLNDDKYSILLHLTTINSDIETLISKISKEFDEKTYLNIIVMSQYIENYFTIIDGVRAKEQVEFTELVMKNGLDSDEIRQKIQQIQNNNKERALELAKKLQSLDLSNASNEKLAEHRILTDKILAARETGDITSEILTKATNFIELDSQSRNRGVIRAVTGYISSLLGHKGGSLNFKQKYLKYKTLYLNIKNST